MELVDTRDSKSLFRKKVSVRVRSVVLKTMLEYITKVLKKREIEAEAVEFQQERDRAEKEKNKELLISYNESLETTTRRRGIKRTRC